MRVDSLVFRLLGGAEAARGISKSVFARSCRSLGVTATDAELADLFRRYDVSGDGVLQIGELAKLLVPADFTSTPWEVQRCVPA